jgi:hypothetical protein
MDTCATPPDQKCRGAIYPALNPKEKTSGKTITGAHPRQDPKGFPKPLGSDMHRADRLLWSVNVLPDTSVLVPATSIHWTSLGVSSNATSAHRAENTRPLLLTTTRLVQCAHSEANAPASPTRHLSILHVPPPIPWSEHPQMRTMITAGDPGLHRVIAAPGPASAGKHWTAQWGCRHRGAVSAGLHPH